MAQGMGGIMSLTGAPDGEPTRAGAPIADIFTGVYSVVGILAALAQRERTGKGCLVDTALLDTQVGVLAQPGAQLSGFRQAAGADRQCASQYRALPGVSGRRRPHHHRARAMTASSRNSVRCSASRRLAQQAEYKTNADRVMNRGKLVAHLTDADDEAEARRTARKARSASTCRPARSTISNDVFGDPQVIHRGMKLDVQSAAAKAGAIPGVRTPIVIGGEPMASPSLRRGWASTPQEILREIGEA